MKRQRKDTREERRQDGSATDVTSVFVCVGLLRRAPQPRSQTER